MKKKLIAVLTAMIMTVAMMPITASAATNETYTIDFYGYLFQSDSEYLLDCINDERIDNDLEPLEWDATEEEYLTDRAAELSIYYSDRTPTGKLGEEDLSGWYDYDVEEFFEEQILDDEDYSELVYDDSIKSFCAGVFETEDDDNGYYIALSYGYEEPDDTEMIYDDDEYHFYIDVKDSYMDYSTEFTTTGGASKTATDLKKGSSYHYWMYNENKEDSGVFTLLENMYTKSSNTSVATITKTGTVKALRAGYAKLTIKPASASSKTFSKTVVVRPQKVTGLTLTTPKKKAVKLSWTKIPGASGYQIYRATSKTGTYKLVKTVTSGSTTTYTNSYLKAKKTYYYKVRGYVKYNDKKYTGSFSDIKYKKTR